MDSYRDKSTKVEIESAYADLNRFVHDEDLLKLATGDGPLLIENVEPDTRLSPKFIETLRHYDWPSRYADSAIEPVPKFEDNDQFLAAMTDGVDIDGRYYYLNNFKLWLSQEPNKEAFDGDMSRCYGSSPALLRACTIAPEFMDALRTTYNSLPTETYFPSREALSSPAGEPVVAGARIAYMLLGRLLKSDDNYRHHELLFGSSDRAQQITDAASTLSA